jgi:SAM-dependent methyltransferase
MAQSRPGVLPFEDLTETTGIPLSPEGVDMMYTRYHLAAEYAAGRRVLELGCGAGQGLGLISRRATMVLGADYSHPLLVSGRRHFGPRVPFVQTTAETLPFRNGAFDLVLFFEASYYVPDMERGFAEIARVLAPGGTVLFVNANPERPDFIQSPYSVRYHTADEFRRALERLGFEVQVDGAFPVESSGERAALFPRALAVARMVFAALGLVPKTLRGRARLKRLLYGTLPTVPAELFPGFGQVRPRTPLPAGRAREHKVLYVMGRKGGGGAGVTR